MQDPLRDQTRPAKKQRQHAKPAPRVPTEPSRRSVRNLGKERPDYKVTARLENKDELAPLLGVLPQAVGGGRRCVRMVAANE